MLILGIDPGTATTGYGIIRVKEIETELVVCGLIETDKDIDKGQRLAKIYSQISTLIKNHKPDVLAIERIFFFSNAKTVINVGQAQGVLLLAATHSKVPLYEYAPGQVKLVVGGSGKADKKVMQKVVLDMFGIEAPNKKKTHFDNVADAIAIAVCHAKLSVNIKNQNNNF